jgi:CRISPR-associated endoribonuclease Cas6
MQLNIEVKSSQEIVLPINYNHIQQSAIFALSGEKAGRHSQLHDNGKNFRNRTYKLFTFGQFEGKYSIKNKMITFCNGFRFEVRSADSAMIENIEKNVAEYGFRLGNVSYHDVSVEKTDLHISTDRIKIRMVSPICVYSTLENGFTRYWKPSDEEFYDAVAENFKRKYMAATGENLPDDIKLEKTHVSERDKVITRYKSVLLEGWKGEYTLSGNPRYLDFLYNCGLGAKNSQGFGMFKCMEAECLR